MLWFHDAAEEAANFYISLFEDSKIDHLSRGAGGEVFTVGFQIAGEKYIALNGGPLFDFNEAFSIYVNCDDQEEVDHFWNAFINGGGTESRCGWLKDKWGLSWQIVPKQLGECLSNPDPEKANRAMNAMMGMKKIIVADLLAAIEN